MRNTRSAQFEPEDRLGYYAWLNGCSSREQARRYIPAEILLHNEPELESKNSFPLFWLAAFASRDQLLVTQHETGSPTRQFIVLCSPIADATARLERRKCGVLSLLPPHFEEFYDEWIAFLRATYSRFLLLRTDDIFASDDDALSGERLLKCLEAFSRAELGQPIADTKVFSWFSAIPQSFEYRAAGEELASSALRWRQDLSGWSFDKSNRQIWPTPPSAKEVAAAKAVPPTLPIEFRRKDSAAERLYRAIRSTARVLFVLAQAAVSLVAVFLGSFFLLAGFTDKPNYLMIAIGSAFVLYGLRPVAGWWKKRR